MPSLRMLPLCLLYRWQPAIREAMTEINIIVLCIQVRIVAVGGYLSVLHHRYKVELEALAQDE